MANMKREICNVTHWEPARGSAEDNIKYCSKESTRVSGPWQFGGVYDSRSEDGLGQGGTYD